MKISPFIVPSLFLSLALSPCALLAASSRPPAELEAAAKSGDAEAQFQLARTYLRGTGVQMDPAKAFELMKKAADVGHPDALGGMGYFYAAGVVVPKDKAAAIAWFRRGADKGSARSKLNLGLLLGRGEGVAKDEAEALRLIDSAADQGLTDALYSQGETYFYGQFGRTRDYPKAFAAFEKAAQDGHASAQNNLGVMLRDALGVSQDHQKAIAWFRKAALQGNVKAQSNLGHQLGLQDSDRSKRLEALTWVMLAAQEQEVTAVKTLEELQPAIPPADLKEARDAVEKFRAKAEQ